MELQRAVRELPVSDHVVNYAVRLVRATRPTDEGAPAFVKKYVHTGAGPRAAESLIVGAKAAAVMQGRLLVTPDDIRLVALPVLRHRIFTNFTAGVEEITADRLVEKLVAELPEPGEQED